MRLNEYNRILIPYASLVPTVFSASSIKQLVARKKVDKVGRSGRGNSAEIVYDTMSGHYKEKIKSVLGDPRKVLDWVPDRALKGSVDRIPFQSLTPVQLRTCNAKYNLVKAFRAYADTNASEIGRVAAKHEFISLYAIGHLCKHERAILGAVSFQSPERWNKELREGGEVIDALAPGKRDNVQTVSVTPEQQQQLISLYLDCNQPTITAVYRQTCREWTYKRITDIPSLTASRRFLNAWIVEHNDVVTLHRLGEKAFKEKCMTPNVAKAFKGADLVEAYGDIRPMIGVSGVGKTTALKAIRERKPSAILVQVYKGIRKNRFLAKLCREADIDALGSFDDLFEALCDKLKGTGRLIMIDKAEHLPIDAIDALRRINDFMGCGLPMFYARLKEHQRRYGYVYNWMSIPIVLDLISKDDTRKLINTICPDSLPVEVWHQAAGGVARDLKFIAREALRVAQLNSINASDGNTMTKIVSRVTKELGRYRSHA